MGMATFDDSPRRPANSHKLWWCADCDAQFGENKGQWMRGWSVPNGTMPDGFEKSRNVPAGVCVMCESENIHAPIDE